MYDSIMQFDKGYRPREQMTFGKMQSIVKEDK